MNATFRAISKAGLNKAKFPALREVIFVSESEAAALFTARFIRESLGFDFLRVGQL